MADEFTTSAFIPAMPMAVYLAWLDGVKHGEMTGADAHCEPVRGGPYDAWDGYIHGTTLELDPGRRIVQRWRTAEFPGDAPDSTVEIKLAPEGNGTRFSIKHTGIPEGQGKLYESGWQDHYFRPMQEYFIHAGISGVPAGASLTEILHRVSTGEATPSAPSLPVFREQAQEPVGIVESSEVADARQPVEVVEDQSNASSGDFELADEAEEDDFDTSKTPEPETGSDDYWKHLQAPPKETPAGAAPVAKSSQEPAGRRPARRSLIGAGKAPKSSGRRAGLKAAARPNKKPLAAKKPAAKAGGSKQKPKAKKKPAKKKPAKKQITARRVGGGAAKNKVAKKKPVRNKPAKKSKKTTRKMPARKSSRKAVKKPAKKKPAAKKKPQAKKKKK